MPDYCIDTCVNQAGGVYEYAKSISPDKEIKQLSIRDMHVAMPQDTSLDAARFNIRYYGSKKC